MTDGQKLVAHYVDECLEQGRPEMARLKGHVAELVDVLAHLLLEIDHGLRDVIVPEEDCGVREIHHDLGHVLRLDEEVFDGTPLGHRYRTPRSTTVPTTARTPARSIELVIIGIP